MRDYLDTREVINEFVELRDELDAAKETMEEAGYTWVKKGEDWVVTWLSDPGDNTDEAPGDYEGVFSDTSENYALVSAAMSQDLLDQHFDIERFIALEEFLASLTGYGGDHKWEGEWYPTTLIPDHRFKEYAQETAEEIGAIKEDAGWPYNCIDWDQAADELKQDYTSVELDGTTYWYRS